MKTVIAGLMLMCLASPISAEDPAQAEEQQQKSLTSLLDDIERQRTAKTVQQNTSAVEQNRYLRNELIDVKVERDLLREENIYLRQKLKNLQSEMDRSIECPPGECLTLAEAEEQFLTQHIAHSLSLYRLAEYMHSVIPEEDVEARERLRNIMNNATSDLELMGFDTTNPENFPTLEELMEHFEISHRAHRSTP